MTMTSTRGFQVGPIVPPAGPGRLLSTAAGDLTSHHRQHGPLPQPAAGELISQVRSAGLLGRGGAGFPTWRKLEAVASGRRPVVVANGAEGEPASTKDRVLLTRVPHLILDGLQLVATAVGAREAYAYLPAAALRPVNAALAERGSAGWDRISVSVVDAPDAFTSGEESAVVSRIEGGAALPRDTPRRVVEQGVGGAPTLVQNVETLAHLALLARHGAEWFRRQGTPEEPGTFLATLSGAVAAPGVYEAGYGVSLGDLLREAGGDPATLEAVLIGGYHGTWLPASAPGSSAFNVPLSRAGLAPFGANPGAGVLYALSNRACGLAESARIAAYLAGQSAGQCGPCRFGLPHLADVLRRLARGERDRRLVDQVEHLSGLVSGRGACHHPDGAVRFIRSSLRVFAPEVRLHLSGYCRAAA